jgi:hypothetical protein
MEPQTHKERIDLRELKGIESAVEIHRAMVNYQFQEVFTPH